jgi:hypothetical protein
MATFRSSPESPGAAAARRALEWRKGKPTENDRPPPSTLGCRARVLPGQLDFGGHEHGKKPTYA